MTGGKLQPLAEKCKICVQSCIDIAAQILYDGRVCGSNVGTDVTKKGDFSMNLQEFYAVVGGNCDEALSRLMSEAMLRRFVAKFPKDQSFDALKQALADGDRETAFRASHTIKGLCLNLGFGKLLASSEALTEALRHEMPDNAGELFAAVSEDYALTMDAIAKL